MLEDKDELKREESIEEISPIEVEGNSEGQKAEKNKDNKFIKFIKAFFSTLWRWIRRMFWGASKEVAKDKGLRARTEILESPGRIAAKKFFKKKVAVGALVVLVSLFAFVFLAPLFVDIDYNYNDASQSNLAPTMSLRRVPNELAEDVRSIDSHSYFSVGVSNSNKFFIWGITRDNGSKIELKNIPETVDTNKVLYAAGGVDHVAVITTEGQFIGWGNNTQGQYGMDADPKTVLSYSRSHTGGN